MDPLSFVLGFMTAALVIIAALLAVVANEPSRPDPSEEHPWRSERH